MIQTTTFLWSSLTTIVFRSCDLRSVVSMTSWTEIAFIGGNKRSRNQAAFVCSKTRDA